MCLLSIIIPCFNEEQYIAHCLESIANQLEFLKSYIEVLIINDGSNDSTSSIISSFLEVHKVIRYYKTSHNGLSMARNIGLVHSLGEYVMFVDGDDWLEKDCLNDIIEIIKLNDFDIIIGLIEGIQEAELINTYKDPDINLISINESEPDFLIKMQRIGMKIAPSVKYIFRRSLVINNNLLFQNFLHEDQHWSPLLLCYAKSYRLYPKYFYKYRLKHVGLSTNKSLSVANDYLEIANYFIRVRNFFENEKRLFLCIRGLYLLNKINEFKLRYTNSENLALECIIKRHDKLILFLSDFSKDNKWA